MHHPSQGVLATSFLACGQRDLSASLAVVQPGKTRFQGLEGQRLRLGQLAVVEIRNWKEGAMRCSIVRWRLGVGSRASHVPSKPVEQAEGVSFTTSKYNSIAL